MITDPSLVLHLPLWQLDGTSFMEKSAYGHLCTATGALWRPDGRLFDGNDYIALASNVTKGLPALTIIAWAKLSDKSASQSMVGDYNGPNDTSVVFGINDVAGTSTHKVMVDIKGEDSASSGDKNGDTTTLAYGSWYCYGMSWNQSTIPLFVNGLLDNTPAAYVDTQLESTVTLNTTIGAYQPAGGNFNILGTLGELWIFSRAYTPLEIQNIHLESKWRYR